MKAVPPLGGADGTPYTDGNPAMGIEGSPLPAAFYNAVNSELPALIAALGLDPSATNLTQLAEAMMAGKFLNIAALPSATVGADGDEIAIKLVAGGQRRLTLAKLFEGRIGVDQVARDQNALTASRLMLNTTVSTAALVLGKQWEFTTDEWAANSSNYAHNIGSVPYYSSGATITQTFNASGTFTIPAGITNLTSVEIWGAGGGGGGTPYNYGGQGAGGGGGGYTKLTNVAVSAGANIPVTVGNGGNGGANGGANTGGNGGASSFGGFGTAGGGYGGATLSGANPNAGGGAGGTGATVNGSAGGNSGSAGYTNGAPGGNAGGSGGGAGGAYSLQDGISTTPGNNGLAPGGGGGGGKGNSGGNAGGAGANGRIVVTYQLGNMTLRPPTPVTVSATSTYADLFFLYKDDNGTSVLGTDLTVDLSGNGGASWVRADLTVLAAFDGTYSFVRARANLLAVPTALDARVMSYNNKTQRFAAPSLCAE